MKVNTLNKECFVIMPISNVDGYPLGHFNLVYQNIICPACKKADFNPFRADQDKASNLIQLEILRKLLDAPLVICDLSTRNPNVLFELGIRQAFDQPVVLIQEEGTPPIFDIGTLRFLTYKRAMQYQDVLETQERLKEAILATCDPDTKGKNSIVSLLELDAATLPIQSTKDKKDLENKYLLSEMKGIKEEMKRLYSLVSDLIPSKKYSSNSNYPFETNKKDKEKPLKMSPEFEDLVQTMAEVGFKNYLNR